MHRNEQFKIHSTCLECVVLRFLVHQLGYVFLVLLTYLDPLHRIGGASATAENRVHCKHKKKGKNR